MYVGPVYLCTECMLFRRPTALFPGSCRLHIHLVSCVDLYVCVCMCVCVCQLLQVGILIWNFQCQHGACQGHLAGGVGGRGEGNLFEFKWMLLPLLLAMFSCDPDTLCFFLSDRWHARTGVFRYLPACGLRGRTLVENNTRFPNVSWQWVGNCGYLVTGVSIIRRIMAHICLSVIGIFSIYDYIFNFYFDSERGCCGSFNSEWGLIWG